MIPPPLLIPSQHDVMVALWRWLTLKLPDYTIIQGQQNNVPTPQSPFGIFQIISRKRTCTNAHIINDTETTIIENLNVRFQFSAFGETAGDDVMMVQMSWRDFDSCSWFDENFPYMLPTIADEPVQTAFITAEKQYENMWSVDLHANLNKFLTQTAQTANQLKLEQLTLSDQNKTIYPK